MKKLILFFAFLCVSLCFGQEFKLNSNGTSETLIFKQPKTAHELFESSHAWAYKYYIFPDKVINQTDKDKSIILQGSTYNVLPDKNYRAQYQITLSFYDGYYTVDYKHLNFVFNEDILDYPLTMITKEQTTSKIKYESSINEILKDLNYYIINNNSPETTRQ